MLNKAALPAVVRVAVLLLLALHAALVHSADEAKWKWVVSGTGSVQGPYPAGNPSAQPEMKLVFPSPESGARDQSFRMVVKPGSWGREARLRFSNAFGTRPVKFVDIFIGLHQGSSTVVAGT